MIGSRSASRLGLPVGSRTAAWWPAIRARLSIEALEHREGEKRSEAVGSRAQQQETEGGLSMATRGQQSGTVFYGWWVVLAAGIGLALHAGPLIVPTFGVFLKPLSQEFGWSRTQLSLAF